MNNEKKALCKFFYHEFLLAECIRKSCILTFYVLLKTNRFSREIFCRKLAFFFSARKSPSPSYKSKKVVIITSKSNAIKWNHTYTAYDLQVRFDSIAFDFGKKSPFCSTLMLCDVRIYFLLPCVSMYYE